MSDLSAVSHGSIVTVTPLTEAARQWIDDHVDHEGWQWFGYSLCVEPRYVGALLEGAQADGLTVSGDL